MANRPELQGSGRNKGVSRVIKMNKRAEAEERNSRTPEERTKAHRLNREPIVHVKGEVSTKGRKRRNRKADAEVAALHEQNTELLTASLD